MRDQPDPSIRNPAQSAMTKKSYKSYRKGFIQWAIDNKLTSASYIDAIGNDGPEITSQYLANQGIFPICSSQNAAAYIENCFSEKGRRRGNGMVTYAMGLQLMKALTDLRTQEFRRKIPQLQNESWRLSNIEFAQVGKVALRTPDVENLLTALRKREDEWKMVNCVPESRVHPNFPLGST